MGLPAPLYDEDGITIHLGDCLEILPELDPVDVIITDPVWPNTPPGMFPGIEPWALFAEAAAHFPRLASTGRVIVILGQDSDPRFLEGVPPSLPFLQLCWMDRFPPSYRGSIMRTADVAHVFGPGWLGVKGNRILPAKAKTSSRGRRPVGSFHPCYRCMKHMRWLIHHYTRPGQTILDPFAGQGTTLIAARDLGRRAVGIDINETFCGYAIRDLGQTMLPGFEPPAPEAIEVEVQGELSIERPGTAAGEEEGP